MVMTAWSGAEPVLFWTATLLKKPSAWTRLRPRSIMKALTGSPSATWNSRRITKSLVFLLPTMSMRSTRMRGPGSTRKATSIVRRAASRFGHRPTRHGHLALVG